MYREIRGLFTLVPGQGSYSIVAEGAARGLLSTAEEETVFAVPSTGSFIPKAGFTVLAPTPAPSPINTIPPSPSLSFTTWRGRIWHQKSVFIATSLFLFFPLASDLGD
jgi:hypothetical protein